MGAIFAEHGGKQVPFNGYYFGPERIAHRPGAKPAVNSTNPGRGGWHWLMQPVIDVAADGRSAKMRARLFHPATGNAGGGIEGGMYPNNQAVLEKGAWKLWSLTIDEPYFSSHFPHGWSRTVAAASNARGAPGWNARAARRAPSSTRPTFRSPLLGKRMEGFAGGTGETVEMARHPEHVVPLQEPRERTRAGALLAQLRDLRIRASDQHGQVRLHAAAVLKRQTA